MGMLIPYKLESKRHLFSRNDIDRLKLIKTLIRDKGLNFSGVRALMGMIPCWAIRECSEEDRSTAEHIQITSSLAGKPLKKEGYVKMRIAGIAGCTIPWMLIPELNQL